MQWNGAQGTVAAQMAFSPTPHVTGGGFQDLTFQNIGGSATTTNPTIGLLMGSSTTAGGAHSVVQYNTFIGFGQGLVLASGTYDTIIINNTFRGNGNSIVDDANNNSGESNQIENNWIVDQGNSSALDCVLFEAQSSDMTTFAFNVTDNCEIHQMAGSNVWIYGNKSENAGSSYGSFPAILQDTDANNTTNLNVYGEKVFNDGTSTSTSFSFVYNLGANANIDGTVVQRGSVASSVPELFTNAAGTNTANIRICNTSNNLGTGYVLFGDNTPALLATSTAQQVGCVTQVHNGFLTGQMAVITATNQITEYFAGGGIWSTVEGQPTGGNTSGVFQYFGGPASPSSTVDDGGSFGRKVCTYNASTTIAQYGGAQCSIYVGLNTAASVTLTLPVATSTQNRDIVFKTGEVTSTIISLSATSTDCFRLMDASTVTSSSIILTAATGSSTVELVDTGGVCGGAYTGDIWEEISKQ